MDKLLLLITKKIIQRKLISFAIIPLLLFLLWPLLSILIVPRQSLTVVSENIKRDERNLFPPGKLLKNEKISGEFKAGYDNLGIISVHLGLFSHRLENMDRLLFRIREKGSSRWHYETIYDSGFFKSYIYSPFGFPIINNSKGKIYEFEIISSGGTKSNSVTVFKGEPIYITKYKYSSIQMYRSENLRNLLLKNIFATVSDRVFISYSSVFFLPFFFYIFYLLHTYPPHLLSNINFNPTYLNLGKTKKLISAKHFFFIILLSFILYDTFFINIPIYGFLLGLVVFWILFDIKYKIEVRLILIIAFGFFLLAQIFIFLDLKPQLAKSSIWLYTFLWIIFFHFLIETKKLIRKLDESK